MQFGGARSPFPLIWRKISVRVELRGVVGGRVRLKSDPSTLLEGLEVGPRDCSARGCFCSSRFSTIRVSAAMKWFALYIISSIVVRGFSTRRMRIRDRSNFGCESTDELGKRLLPSLGNAEERGGCGLWSGACQKILLQFPCELVKGENGSRTEPGIPHLSWSLQGGLEDPTYEVGNLKLVGIGLSCISGAKGEPRLELSPAYSFDLVTSFCTSSSRLFTRRSCTRSESVEFDDNVSGSCVVCSTPRYRVVDFSGTIDGASNRVSGGSCAAGPGRTGTECSQEPPWLIRGRWGSG
ncbi:hypothetical protein BHM03_00020517 [Ensete ventricosum]|nr:hypothetical protein BHM03_00020517 [Ensete ventricosum]